MAKEVGLSHVAIGNFLAGQLPKSEHLIALAEFFGVTTDWLLGCNTETSASVFNESPEHLIDDAPAQLKPVKEKMQSLERALHRLKTGK